MLREWNVPFRALLDAAPDGILVCDGHGTIVLVNSEAERMFGYARDELLGQPIDVLIPDHVRPRHQQHLAAFATDPKLRPMAGPPRRSTNSCAASKASRAQPPLHST